MLAPRADAALTGDTAVTFSLTAGQLSITVPSAATLSSASTGATSTSGALGTTQVDDGRGDLVATWTVYVTSTNFTTGGGSADETIPKANVSYNSGSPTAGSSGTGTFTGTLVGGTPAAVPLAVDHTAGAAWAGVGVNHQNFNPTISVNLLNSNNTKAVAGTYSGTITQSLV